MEARIARLESEVKVDLRSLRDQLNARIDRLAERLDNKFEAVDARFDDLKSAVAST